MSYPAQDTAQTRKGRLLKVFDKESNESFKVRWFEDRNPEATDIQGIVAAYRERKKPAARRGDVLKPTFTEQLEVKASPFQSAVAESTAPPMVKTQEQTEKAIHDFKREEFKKLHPEVIELTKQLDKEYRAAAPHIDLASKGEEFKKRFPNFQKDIENLKRLERNANTARGALEYDLARKALEPALQVNNKLARMGQEPLYAQSRESAKRAQGLFEEYAKKAPRVAELQSEFLQEDTWNELKEGGFFRGLQEHLTVQLPKAISGTAGTLAAQLEKLPIQSSLTMGVRTAAEFVEEVAGRFGNKLERKAGAEDQFLYDLGQGSGSIISAFATAVPATFLGGPAAGIAAGFSVTGILEGGLAYDEAKKYGLSKGDAANVGLGVGIVNGALEMLPIAKLLKKTGIGGEVISEIRKEIIERGLAKTIGKTAATQGRDEAMTEFMQELSSLTAETLYKRAEDQPELQEWLERGGYSALLGGILGFGYGSVGVAAGVGGKEKTVSPETGRTEAPPGLKTAGDDLQKEVAPQPKAQAPVPAEQQAVTAQVEAEAKKTLENAGVRVGPVKRGLMQFDDPVTKSTLYLPVKDITPENVQQKLKASRAKFAPWQMTKENYASQFPGEEQEANIRHQESVKKAVEEGKRIEPEVLAEYPGLGEKKEVPTVGEVKKVKDFKTEEGSFSTYDVAKDVRGRADMFTVLKDKDGYIVRNALIPEEMRRKGIASKFYQQMNEESIAKTGNPLRSTQPRRLVTGETVHELSDDAVKLWDSFVEKGLAEKIGDKNYRFKGKEQKPPPVEEPVGVKESPRPEEGGAVPVIPKATEAQVGKQIEFKDPDTGAIIRAEVTSLDLKKQPYGIKIGESVKAFPRGTDYSLVSEEVKAEEKKPSPQKGKSKYSTLDKAEFPILSQVGKGSIVPEWTIDKSGKPKMREEYREIDPYLLDKTKPTVDEIQKFGQKPGRGGIDQLAADMGFEDGETFRQKLLEELGRYGTRAKEQAEAAPKLTRTEAKEGANELDELRGTADFLDFFNRSDRGVQQEYLRRHNAELVDVSSLKPGDKVTMGGETFTVGDTGDFVQPIRLENDITVTPEPGDKLPAEDVEKAKARKIQEQAERRPEEKGVGGSVRASGKPIKNVNSYFTNLVDNARSELENVLDGWQEAKLNEDGTGIISNPFSREAPKGSGPTVKLGKSEFFDWLYSDKPFDTKMYGEGIADNAEWKADIEKLRELNPELKRMFAGQKTVGIARPQLNRTEVENRLRTAFTSRNATEEQVVTALASIEAHRNYAYPELSEDEAYAKIYADLTASAGAPDTALFQYIGENANLRDNIRENLHYARYLETQGMNTEKIRLATGWVRNPFDSKWRYEIQSDEMLLNVPMKDLTSKEALTKDFRLGNVVKYDELFRAYPQLKNVTVDITDSFAPGIAGSWNPLSATLHLNREYLAGTKSTETLRKVLVHEIQHAIQYLEGFARGGNLKKFLPKEHDDLLKEQDRLAKQIEKYNQVEWVNQGLTEKQGQEYAALIDKFQDVTRKRLSFEKNALENYEKVAGEIESRDVEARLNLTREERRAIPPMSSEQIAPDQAIVLFGEEVGTGEEFAIPVETAKKIDIPVELPDTNEFRQVVKNTPGAEITKDGLKLDVSRYQQEEQEGQPSLRTGVFYMTEKKSPYRRYFKGGGREAQAYGGSQEIISETLVKHPFVIKAAAGGRGPQLVYDKIKGNGSYERMRSDALAVSGKGWYGNKVDVASVEEFLTKHGGDPDLAGDIIQYSRYGNTLPYALQEHVVAHAVRDAGYDSVLSFTKRREGLVFSELFDVRENIYPTEDGGFGIHPKFDPTGELSEFSVQRSVTRTPAFRKWFGKSKVVDESGEPLVVYHGTGEGGLRGNAFNKAMLGSVTKAKSAKAGFFFVPDEGIARGYSRLANEKPVADLIARSEAAERAGKWGLAHDLIAQAEKLEQTSDPKENIVAAYLSIQNPFEFDAQEQRFLDIREEIHDAIDKAMKGGHDGIVLRNLIDNADWGSSQAVDHWIAFEPTQIKSTTNRGTFDPNDPNITHSISSIRQRIEQAESERKKLEEELSPLIEKQAQLRREIEFAESKNNTEAAGKARQKLKPIQKRIGEIRESLERPLFGTEQETLFQDSTPPNWYFSGLQRILESKMPNKASVEQIRAIIRDAKKEEVQWTGLDEFLNTKSTFTKEEILNHLKENEVKVEEVVKGGDEKKQFKKLDENTYQNGYDVVIKNAPTKLGREYGEDNWQIYSQGDLLADGYTSFERAVEGVQQAFGEDLPATETKFSNYVLPGAKEGTYRELLLTLPMARKTHELRTVKDATDEYSLRDEYGNVLRSGLHEDQIDHALAELAQEESKQGFVSGHFDEPNVFAHIRFNERTDADGKRVLFIEEIQSDWAQRGRKEGFSQEKVKAEDLRAVYEEETRAYRIYDKKSGQEVGLQRGHDFGGAQNKLTPDEAIMRFTEELTKGVPPLPFAKNWHEVAMRRAIRWAAENGFDALGFTTGEQQAERYDLSKQVRKVSWAKYGDDDLDLYVTTLDAEDKKMGRYTLDKLPDVIGKDLAKKIADEFNAGEVNGEYTGLDLRVGGEGQKGFYDKILVDYANKFGKKFGSRVQDIETQVGVRPNPDRFQIVKGTRVLEEAQTRIIAEDLVRTTYPGAKVVDTGPTEIIGKVHSLPITREMRDAAMRGLPLFQQKKGAVQFLEDGRAVIHAFESADFSTMMHELGHVFRRHLKPQDLKIAEDWAGVKDGKWTKEAEEKFARGFERYLADGKAPTEKLKEIFEQFKKWMLDIYKEISGSEIDIKLSPAIRDVFDRIMGKQENDEAADILFQEDTREPIAPTKAQNDKYIHELITEIEKEKKPRKRGERKRPVVALMKDAIGVHILEGVAKGLRGAKLIEYVRGGLAKTLKNTDEYKAYSASGRLQAAKRLETENVNRWIQWYIKEQRKQDAQREIDRRNERIVAELGRRLASDKLPKDVAEGLLRTAEKYRTNNDTQSRFWSRFFSRVSEMTVSYGAAGGELTNRMYNGDIERGALTEQGNVFLDRIKEVYDKYKADDPTRDDISAEVVRALEDRLNAQAHLKSEEAKAVYKDAKAMLDHFKDLLEKKGYQTTDDYFTHMRNVDIIDRVFKSVEDPDAAKGKPLNDFITASSAFLKPRTGADMKIHKDVPYVLSAYLRSVTRELAYKDGVQYYYERFLKDIPVALQRNNMDRAKKFMKNVLEPERGKGKFFRAINFIRNNQYRNFLGMNLKASAQNLTQPEFARFRWLPEADKLRKKLWRQRTSLTGALADAVDIASAETPRYLELIKAEEGIKSTHISELFNRIDTFQKSEGRNWGIVELGSILNSAMKHPDYKTFKASKGQVGAVQEILSVKENFDKAVREAASTAAETQVASAPSMRGEFYDSALSRVIGMFTAFKFRQLQVLGEAMRSQEGLRGFRAQLILRRGLSGEIEPVEVLREVEGNRKAMERLLEVSKKYKRDLGVSYDQVQEFINYLKAQETDLNGIIEQIEPTKTKARAVAQLARYYAKVTAISMFFSILWDVLDAAIDGDDDDDDTIITQAIKRAFFDILPTPFYGTNPARFLVSPVAPNLENTMRFGNFSERGLARDVITYGLNVIPFAGIVERASGRRISKFLIDEIAPSASQKETPLGTTKGKRKSLLGGGTNKRKSLLQD